MLLYASKLVGKNIIDSLTLHKIGTTGSIIIDPNNGQVLAFTLNKKFFWEKPLILTMQDVSGAYIDGIVVRSIESIVPIDEVVRVKKVWDQKIFLLKARVTTQNGNRIGYIEDFIFDTVDGRLATIVVKKLFSGERRIINANRIISIDRYGVVVRDLLGKVEFTPSSKKIKGEVGFSPAVE
ncbi:MAG TPA: PRC-barrel domain-containing protein [Patescibacteria group bacterium]|nr:PRC-barrel domain-containing protein [Patescibacteria group bacterium]